MKVIALPLFCLAAFIASPANAREAAFVSPEQIQPFQILPTPPDANSKATKKELAELHRIEKERTKQQAAQAMADDKNETVFLFNKEMGEKFTPEALPITAAFTTKVKGDQGINSSPAKVGFHRVHPYNLDKSLHPICETKTKDDSYPSGHTMAGYMLALTLIDMVPEKRDAILARAEDFGNNRLICGVQYRSDLQASKLLAYSVHAVMSTNPQYQKELAAAKLELRQALGLPVSVPVTSN
jgi:acid phosphatase (class A)